MARRSPRPREYAVRVVLPSFGAWLAKGGVIAVFLAGLRDPRHVPRDHVGDGRELDRQHGLGHARRRRRQSGGERGRARRRHRRRDGDRVASLGQQLATTARNIAFALVLVVFGWTGGKGSSSSPTPRRRSRSRSGGPPTSDAGTRADLHRPVSARADRGGGRRPARTAGDADGGVGRVMIESITRSPRARCGCAIPRRFPSARGPTAWSPRAGAATLVGARRGPLHGWAAFAGLVSHFLHDAGDDAAPTPLFWPFARARQLGRRPQLIGTVALALASLAISRATAAGATSRAADGGADTAPPVSAIVTTSDGACRGTTTRRARGRACAPAPPAGAVSRR